MSIVFGLIFATLGSTFSSFAAAHAYIEFERRCFFELEGLTLDSLFIFCSFGSAPTPVLRISIVVGRLFVLLNSILLMSWPLLLTFLFLKCVLVLLFLLFDLHLFRPFIFL
jgi:hypothetical protein